MFVIKKRNLTLFVIQEIFVQFFPLDSVTVWSSALSPHYRRTSYSRVPWIWDLPSNLSVPTLFGENFMESVCDLQIYAGLF